MRGGYRPGSGRPHGSKDKKPRYVTGKKSREAAARPRLDNEEKEKIKKMMAFDLKAKAAMYQDFLVKISQGKKLTLAEKRVMIKIGAELSGEAKEYTPAPKIEDTEPIDPLTYMLNIMRDPKADPEIRARMAIAAAPFVHQRVGEKKGKKDEKADRAKQAGAGKFAPSAPPVLKVVGK